MAIRVWPYKNGSRSARVLADALGSLTIKKDKGTSVYKGRLTDYVINWGNSMLVEDRFNAHSMPCILNHPNAVNMWADKINSYHVIGSLAPLVSLPYTIHYHSLEGLNWNRVVARYVLRGHGGVGIEVFDQPNDRFNDARVYTKYIKKRREYRLHFFKQNSERYNLLLQQKRRNFEVDDPNWEVRNHANGFIYAVDNVDPIPEEPLALLKDSIKHACNNLDFGAVDIVEANNQNGELSDKFIILEVNTACGIESDRVRDFYVSNILERVT